MRVRLLNLYAATDRHKNTSKESLGTTVWRIKMDEQSRTDTQENEKDYSSGAG